MRRRDFLGVLTTAIGSTAIPAKIFHGDQSAPFQVYEYKTAGGCVIEADVHGADKNIKKPVLMYIHGGALIGGTRKKLPKVVPDLLLKMGYVVVLIDYRLAPETKLPAIVEDVQDAILWIRRDGPKLFHIDPDRLAIVGDSAGGYLTLMTGFRVKPRPRVLAVFWGYGDIISPWYSKPDAFYLKRPRVSKEEAYQSVGTKCLTEPAESNQRGRFYLYCRQNGLWPQEIAGHDPHVEPEWFNAYRPVHNVSKEYPPTILVHGTADTDVPYEESKTMAQKLEEAGVEHELITVSGGGHGLAEISDAEMTRIYEKVAAFLRANMG
jgi:acetyl esterase/lipase